MSGYLRPTAPIFDNVVLPADPGVALALAQKLLVKPLMANHSFGLWGYSGETQEGTELTIQAAGIGGPSAATVLAELAAFGAKRVIAVDTCCALGPELAGGAGVIAVRVCDLSGAGTQPGIWLEPDLALSAALAAAAPNAQATAVASIYSANAWKLDPAASGAAVADLASAALLGAAARLEIAVASALAVADESGDSRSGPALLELGAAAAHALAASEMGP